MTILDLLDEDLLSKDNIKAICDNIKEIIYPKNLPKFFTVLLYFDIYLITFYNPIKKDDSSIHMAINIDLKYFYPSLVFLTSLMDNRASSTFYNIHILIGDSITKMHYKNIYNLIKKKGNNHVKVKFHKMGNEFQGATHGRYISIADYYRIALPSLLPTVDKILYIDTDVINFKDLSEMYNIEINDDIYFMGTLDNIGLMNELRHIRKLTKYMNAGILIMNLKGIRKYGIEQKIRKYISKHFLNHHDQTAINAVCYKNLGILSIKYATFVYKSFEDLVEFNKKQNKIHRYKNDELIKAYYEPTLLHYVGWVKPWEKRYSNSKEEYWWYYAKKSGYFEEIISNYQFSRERVNQLLEKIPKNGGLLRKFEKSIVDENI